MNVSGPKWTSALMERTRVRRAAANRSPLQCHTVAGTHAIRDSLLHEVPGVRSASAPEHPQGFANPSIQLRSFLGIEGARGARRIQPGSPQHFVGQQIAETGDPRLVHQDGLERSTTGLHQRRELRGGQRQRVHAKALFVGIELDRSQSPRVTEQQRPARAEPYREPGPARIRVTLEVIQPIVRGAPVDEHSAGHPEVQTEHRTGAIGVEEQQLAAPAGGNESAADQLLREPVGVEPALQIPRVGRAQRGDATTQGVALDQLPRGLQFQDLRHD